MATPKVRHFSMLRDFHLADLVTLANGISGAAATLLLMKFVASGDRALLGWAFVCFPAAFVFDAADGRIARWRRESSSLGQELDSLADLVSFGVAPAACAFALGMQSGWDALVLVYFVACGISRLARYNVTSSSLADESGKVKYFEGTPIPTSLLLVAVLAALTYAGKTGPALPFGLIELGPFGLHPLVLLYALSGSAMVSKTLHIPKP